MNDNNNYLKTKVLVVGAGVAGLSFSIALKKLQKDIEICVIDKSENAGNHILSGALIEADTLDDFICNYITNIDEDAPLLKETIKNNVNKEGILFFPNSKLSIDLVKLLKISSKFYSLFSKMLHKEKNKKGDYIVSLSSFVRALEDYALKIGVEVYHSFSAENLLFSDDRSFVRGIKLKNQGLDKDGNKQINYKEGEEVEADYIILAEGADGLLTENLVREANLKRTTPQIFSIGVKEVISVTKEQYETFGRDNVFHVLGYPLFNFTNLNMFGGGILYPVNENELAVGMIVGLDYKYNDFVPQDALVRFKEHPRIKKFIEGGKVIEAGAKMIPEGGYNAIPRGSDNEIGFKNVVILGDSASLVDMRKIKGVHNAIKSGVAAAKGLVNSIGNNLHFAINYTNELEKLGVLKELYISKNYRQIIEKLGNFFGMPISIFSNLIPFNIKSKEDYKHMSLKSYPLKLEKPFNKGQFVGMAKAQHREDEPRHLIIKDNDICLKCEQKYKSPCISFCPAEVYEKNFVKGYAVPLNPSNCLHCKTCQRKCPFNNIIWSIPEGGEGAKYKKS